MANWLSRATEVFRKPPPPAPEPYSVRCDCGGTVAGFRVSAAQRPSCPHCGRQVFILPANVYPNPIRTRKPAAPEAVSETKEQNRPGTNPEHPHREGKRDSAAATGKSDRKTRHAQQSAAPVPQGILLESQTRILTPFRMVIVAIIGVGAVTVWGVVHRQRIESAKTQVVLAREAGMKAFKDGEFSFAARELTRARQACDLLGRKDHEANSIRRLSLEATAAQGLSDSGLFELLAHYATSPNDRSRFGSLHKGAWLVLDAVILVPEHDSQTCSLDLPLMFDDVKFRIDIHSDSIRSAALKDKNLSSGPGRVIFAAQMDSLNMRSPTEAVLELNGQTAFLWTSFETLEFLGYHNDDAKEVLLRQLEQQEARK